MSFSGKVVLVTGAASGIGAATAELFATEGAAVVMVDKDGINLQLATERNASKERNVFAITADVANDEDAKRIVKQTIDKFGKLDILVNCAGIIRFGTILDGNLMQSYDELMTINLRALMQITCQAAPHLIKSKGNIVNIASIAATHTYSSNLLAYSVSKCGVKHFSRGAAIELAPYGVRVNTVSPGSVRTNLLKNSGYDSAFDLRAAETPLEKICEPGEIADLVLYLTSDKAKSITGTDVTIDNGKILKYVKS